MAIINPEQKPYKKLTPFCLCMYTNFPFIEETFDSMTNYEMLCKIVEYLNNVIYNTNTVTDNQINLCNAFVELKNYVDNFFNNLDVQDEINNKLDEMAEDGSLANAIAPYITNAISRTYNTVLDMQQDTTLLEGMFCKTLGFFQVGDGGSSYYKIKDNLEANNSNIIAISNNLFAEFININNIINYKQFGIHQDSETDDYQNLQNLIDYASSNKISKIIGNLAHDNSLYMCISQTLHIPAYFNIENLFLKSLPDGNYTNNYMISINSTNVENPDNTAPSSTSNYLKNVKLLNYNNNIIKTNLNGIYCACNIKIQDLYTNGIDKTIQCSPNYFDYVHLNNVQIYHKAGQNYAINLANLGDSIKLDFIHLFEKLEDAEGLLISTGYANYPININNVINGKIKINGGIVNLNNCHFESVGGIEIENAIVYMKNIYMWAISDRIKASNWSFLNCENLLIRYDVEHNSFEDFNEIDINLTKSNCKIVNCYKDILIQGLPQTHYLSQIKTSLDTQATDINRELFFSNNKAFNFLKDYKPLLIDVGAGALSTSPNIKWQLSTNNYYYKIRPMADFSRKVGHSTYTGNFNVSLSQNGNGVIITGLNPGVYIVYRGTAQNQYNKYAIIPLMSNTVFDNGYCINGYNWLDREVSDMDSINNFYNPSYNADGTIICNGSSKPTVGTWKKGDIVLYNSPNSGNMMGWYCSQAGTPGTWLQMPVYSSGS